MKEEMDEPEEEINETEEQINETEEKNSPEELPVLARFTKKQVQEVYALLEEGKNLEEISRFFEEKYKCKPLSKERLQKHALKFHKLKLGNEKSDHDGGDNKTHDLEAPSSEITNQDIEEMKEKMLSAPESLKKEKSGTASSDSPFFGIDMKWVIVAAVVIIIVVILLLRGKKQQEIPPTPVPESAPEQKPQEPQIKWV